MTPIRTPYDDPKYRYEPAKSSLFATVYGKLKAFVQGRFGKAGERG